MKKISSSFLKSLNWLYVNTNARFLTCDSELENRHAVLSCRLYNQRKSRKPRKYADSGY